MQAKKAGMIGILIAAPVFIPITRTMAEEGLRANFTFGERLRYVGEEGFASPQNEGTSLVTTLGFGLLSESSNQVLSLNLGTDIPFYASDNDSFNSTFTFEDPFARLGYTIQNRSSLLALNTSYRRTDVGTSNFFDETINEDVVTGGGKRELYSFNTDLTLGQDGPVTTNLGYRYLRSEYDQADPSLSDSTTQSVDGRVDFRISPLASIFVFGDWRQEDRDLASQSDRTTTSAGIGTRYEITPVTSATAQVSYDTDESDTNSNDGIGFRAGLDRALSNGSLGFDISGTETLTGFRQEASVGRNYNLPRGSFAFSLGVVKDEGTSIEPLANLSLSLGLTETSQFTVNLSQRPDFDDDDIDVIRTRLSIGYDLEINSLSSLSADIRLANDNRFGTTAADSRSVLASLSYNRAVGNDWDLVSGLSYEADQNANQLDTNTTTFFVGIERSFDFRP